MSPKAQSFSQLIIGVVLSLAVGTVAISWIASRGLESAGRSLDNQTATVSLSALTDLVEATRDNEGDPQAAVRGFFDDHDDLRGVRVIDIEKRMLLASTYPEDHQEGSPPYRLQRKNEAHKDWYDRGQALRAAVDSNLEEGRAWKKEIEAATNDKGELVLAGPLLSDGKVVGTVLIEGVPEGADTAPRSTGSAVLFALAAAALFLIVGKLAGPSSPWLKAVALVAVTCGLAASSMVLLQQLVDARLAAERAVAQRLLDDKESFRTAISDLPAAAVILDDPSAWDRDAFGQPRGILTADGTVLREVVDAQFAPTYNRFRNVFVVLILLGLGLAGFVGFGHASHAWRTFVTYREAYTYVTPAILSMIVLVFLPFFYGLLLSFTNQTLYNLNEPIYDIWVGFDNYVKVLTDFDLVRAIEGQRSINYENFYYTLFFTVVWTITNVTIGVSVGLALALILNTKGLTLRPIYRVLLILPWALPNYITALIWSGMFHQQFGVINQVLQIFGMEPVAWFDHPFTSYLTVLATNGWLSFPFMMVVSLGALQSIPSDLYEAARVDGASRWQQFRLITLPSLKPALVPAVILSVVWTFNQFNVIYLVSGGDPSSSTEILITQAYKLAFEQYQYGYAAAYATVIFAILLVYGTWQNRVTKASEGV